MAVHITEQPYLFKFLHIYPCNTVKNQKNLSNKYVSPLKFTDFHVIICKISRKPWQHLVLEERG